MSRGCIIRAAFLDRIRAAYENNKELPTLLADEEFGKEIAAGAEETAEIVDAAVTFRAGGEQCGFATPMATMIRSGRRG